MKIFTKSKRERFEKEAMPLIDTLYRFALSRTGDSAEADDLVQETYLKAWDAFDSYESGTNCRAWLCRILRNTHINRIRSSSREYVTDEIPESTGAQTLPGWSFFDFEAPEDASWLKFTRQQIMSAFDRMPADFRSVVELADVEGFSYKEIADILSIPIGTVMSRLHRGRRVMREMLIACGVTPEGVRRAKEGAEEEGPVASGGASGADLADCDDKVISLDDWRMTGGGRS
jgi:RNA polymerase sigma-70 factor (ECF subfamily)